jgi:hypothetical protein
MLTASTCLGISNAKHVDLTVGVIVATGPLARLDGYCAETHVGHR